MTDRIKSLSVGLAATAAALLHAVALAGDARVVLLRNGNVLSGTVHTTARGVEIRRSDSTIYLRTDEVKLICEDLGDAYQQQRKSLAASDTLGHLRLADWCLRHGLLAETAQLIEVVEQLQATHLHLAPLKRRLAVAKRPATLRSGAHFPERKSHSSDTDGTGIERASEQVFPDQAVEQFRQTVQPVLLNSCTSGGCHGSDGGPLALDRRTLSRDSSLRATSANLDVVMDFVNRKQPEKSSLLQAAVRKHATNLRRPPLTPSDPAYAAVRAWVESVADPPDEPIATNANATGSNYFTSTASQGHSRVDDTPNEPAVRRAAPVQLKRRQQVDPYDPEEFNRRFSSRRR